MKKLILFIITALLLGIFAEAEDLQQSFDDTNRLVQEEYLDGQGNLYTGDKGFARHVLTYGEDNTVREAYYNEKSELSANKDGVIVLEWRQDENGKKVWYRYLDAQEQPTAVKGVYQLAMGYDEAGNMNQETVLDAEGNRALHPDGWCEHQIVFNELKQKVSERWLGVDGQPVLFKDDYSGIDRVFDADGHVLREAYYDITGNVGPKKNGSIVIEHEYNDLGQNVKNIYLDADLNPMLIGGVYQMAMGYDEAGNMNLETVLDAEGNRTLHPDGWCEHQIVFNELKQKVSERWLGIDGQPVLFKDDYSGIDRVYDENGKVIRETYYDVTGNVGPKKNGSIVIEHEYNDLGQNVKNIYLDADLNPMLVGGVYQMQMGYDEAGNMNLETVLDAEGNRALHPDGWCEHQIVFNELKQKVSERWLDTDGQPVLFKDDYSGIDRLYDENGKVIRETYYDVTGNVGPKKNGSIVIEHEYNDLGQTTKNTYLDADLNPMLVGGVYQMAMGYDDAGNMNLEIALDQTGRRTLHPDGWCEHQIVYNELKQKVSERWLDTDGQPVLFKEDYSGIDRVFDADGHVLRETYYDVTGNVGPKKNGSIVIEHEYNDLGQNVKNIYLDADLNPMLIGGVYQMAMGYDDAGNMNLETVLDAEGNRALHPDGWCEHQIVFNELKQKVSERWLGVDGETVLFKDDYSGIDRVYDENGKVIRETYYDVTGNVGPKKNGSIVIEHEYNDLGQTTKNTYLDADLNPMLVGGVYQTAMGYDEAGNMNLETVLDAEGNRALHPDGWCEHQIVFNELKQKVSERWLDTDGQPVLFKDDYSGIDRVFDADGHVLRETYYDVTGNVGPKKNGSIVIEHEYNDLGQNVKNIYLDADLNPLLIGGVYRMQMGYDEAGNMNLETVLDAEGNRALHPDGWCEHQIVYNELKQKVSERWLGIDGQPALFKDDYSGIDRVFDADGHVLRETYYDVTGNVGPKKNGSIVIEHEYNDLGQNVKNIYLDAYLNPLLVGGVYQTAMGYDEAGNMNLETVLDADGNRALHPDGWCEHQIVYNELKQKVSERWLGIDGQPILFKDDYSGIDRVFDADGHVLRETYYDATGNVGPKKNGSIVIEHEYNDLGQTTKNTYLDADLNPMLVGGVYQTAMGYDEAGNMNQETVLDAEGNRALHPDGWCEHQIVYNELKQKVSERWLGIDGQPALFKDDYSGIDRVFDADGHVLRETYYDITGNVGPKKNGSIVIEHEYNDLGQTTKNTYLDADLNPMLIGGVYQMAMGYDDAGNMNLEIALDQTGRRTLHPDGWCEHHIVYNELKQKVSERWLGIDGSPTLFKGSYSGIDRVFDEDNKAVVETYYDAGGRIGPNKDGKVIVETEYNEEGFISELHYYDAEHNPMMPLTVGACIEQREYDDFGNVCTTRLLDADRKPMRGAYQWATARYVFDENKHKLSEAYYDEKDALCLLDGGYAQITREYDSNGNVTLETYYDQSGLPADNAKGIAIVRREFPESGTVAIYEEYRNASNDLRMDANAGCAIISRFLDDDGHVLRESYFDIKGQAMLNPKKKCASILYEYDESGRVVFQAYYDEAGNPLEVNGVYRLVKSYDASGNAQLEQKFDLSGDLVTGTQGYDAVVRRYDDQKRVTEESYYTLEGERVPCKNGYATALMTYGEEKKPSSVRYFDAEGAPMAVLGYHQVTYTYDENGNTLSESYYDLDGMRVRSSNGYAIVTNRYDWNNKPMETAYYDVDGSLMLIPAGYAVIDYRRDAYGNVELETYRDGEDKALTLKAGYAGIARTFDQNNRVMTMTYLDVDGNPVVTKRLGYATISYDYDAAGKKVRECYYDGEGNPVLPKAGSCAVKTWEYDEQGRVTLEQYWSTKGTLKELSSGYAGIRYDYDDENSIVTLNYLDKNGQVLGAINRLGYSKLRRTLDGAGRVVKEEYLNYKDEPTLNSARVYGRVMEYDAYGRLIREYTFGKDGQPNSGARPYSITEYSYDASGTRTATKYSSSGKKYA